MSEFWWAKPTIFTNPDPRFWDRKKKSYMYISTFMFFRIKLWGDALYVYCVDGKLQAIDEMFIYRYQWVEYMERLVLGTAKVRDRRQLILYTLCKLRGERRLALSVRTLKTAFSCNHINFYKITSDHATLQLLLTHTWKYSPSATLRDKKK